MIDLPDINLWLSLAVTDHPHHDLAQQYWYEAAVPQLIFCRVTALGFMRLLCNQTVMVGQALQPAEAWNAYLTFRALPEVGFLSDGTACEQQLAEWIASGVVTRHLWTNAYLAALAVTGNCRMVSFDKDFERFTGLDFLRLS